MDDLEKVKDLISQSIPAWKFFLNETLPPGTLIVSQDVFHQIRKTTEGIIHA
jgi:hypothetical protein